MWRDLGLSDFTQKKKKGKKEWEKDWAVFPTSQLSLNTQTQEVYWH